MAKEKCRYCTKTMREITVPRPNHPEETITYLLCNPCAPNANGRTSYAKTK